MTITPWLTVAVPHDVKTDPKQPQEANDSSEFRHMAVARAQWSSASPFAQGRSTLR